MKRKRNRDSSWTMEKLINSRDHVTGWQIDDVLAEVWDALASLLNGKAGRS